MCGCGYVNRRKTQAGKSATEEKKEAPENNTSWRPWFEVSRRGYLK